MSLWWFFVVVVFWNALEDRELQPVQMYELSLVEIFMFMCLGDVYLCGRRFS